MTSLGYKMPNREKARSIILPKIVEEIDNRMKERFAANENLNVAFDGWTDVAGLHYMSVIIMAGKESYYIGTIEPESAIEKETGSMIGIELHKILNEMIPNLENIVSIIYSRSDIYPLIIF